MRCLEARELFSPYLDGELSPAENELLRRHLDECPACRGEIEQWLDISRALRGLAAPVAAPPGFPAAAAARLAARRRSWTAVRRFAAAAAAVAVLVAGSLGYAGRGLWPQLPALTAGGQHQDGGQVAVIDPAGSKEPPAVSQPPGSNTNITPAGPAGQQPAGGETPGNGLTPLEPGEKTVPAGTGTGTATGAGAAKDGQPVQVAAGEPYVAHTFLSDRYLATSTMLKIAVADTAGAGTGAAGMAAGSGATIQVIADQDDGQEKKVIYMFKVDESKAGTLLPALERLGQVIESSSTSRDLTQQFSETLEQYQAKVAQVNAATGEEEKEKLAKEARALEQQLLTWEEETKQHTIILWLETK
ncbi:anti-sigma factor family protein [Moorella sulfitireducens]|uniref:anti-sigma factor family protein n=1 Tax=Neomoorella sulfitireducens TaxID=2972948 RepID=UPI0021AD3DEB|nr:zf-HC2 domain-containing protein [Moorella sulfitireducens]